MNMQLMLGVGIACFFLSLFFLCFYKDKLNVKFFNGLFIVLDIIFFLLWNIAAAEKGWLADGFMTMENISPFTFTVIPLTLFMNKKSKEYAFSTIAFLHVGMFLATLISPEYVVIFNYKPEATFVYATEAMCHILTSLFGIYLILTKQVKPDFAHWIKSIVFMLGWITFGLCLNLILDTYCFNLNPNRYGIYMLDIFGSFEATVLAYYLGVIVVLTVGMQSGAGLLKLVEKIKKQHQAHMAVKKHYDDMYKAEKRGGLQPQNDSDELSKSSPNTVR